MKKYPEIVEQIHNEFNTASELLLNEAKEVLANLEQKELEKSNLLIKVGFTNTPEAQRAKKISQEREKPLEQIRLVEYYAMNYPNNKFITEQQVEAICKKYNLVCGPVQLYKGFVPVEKLQSIATFKLNPEDVLCDLIRVTKCSVESTLFGRIQKSGRKFRKAYGEFIERSRFGGHFGVTYRPRIRGHYDMIYIDAYERVDRSKPCICAPAKDMDLKGTKAKGFFRFLTTHVEVPDPVVLQPVKGGYLILAAWGDEASDEIVVNQKMN